MRLLIIDADPISNERLAEHFADHGMEVITATDFEEGLMQWRERQPAFIILDAILPSRPGLELCREIRKHSKVPIIMQSHKANTDDKILGSNYGADDYVAKPCEARELHARIETVLRRIERPTRTGTLQFQGLELNLEKRTVTLEGNPVPLTTLEFEALLYFSDRHGQIWAATIQNASAALSPESVGRSMDVLMSRLRLKLKDDPKNPRFFRTVRGSGYVFIATRKE